MARKGTLEEAKQDLVTLGLATPEEADRQLSLHPVEALQFLMEAPPGMTVAEWLELDRRGARGE
jgi:hypothetical protein